MKSSQQLYRFLTTLVSTEVRRLGIHIAAGKGSGKSRLMGRIIAFLDFIRMVPTVILDPHGGTIDNFLDRMMRLPRVYQEKLWKRVIYVDMSGHWGNIVPFPFYYRLGNESWFEISQRYLDVVYKLDPHLQDASIQGWNPLWRTGTLAGMLLSAMKLQITELEDLITRHDAWKEHLYKAREEYPELSYAVGYLGRLAELKGNERTRLTSSLLNKVALFSFDPITKAMVGASQPAIVWEDVVRDRKIVLLDFRYIEDRTRRQFFLEWSLQYFLSFVLQRGPGRQLPISLFIDELTALFSVQGLESGIFRADLDNLINVISRQYSLWLTICHQEHFQLPEDVNKSLVGLGTQILGVTRDREAAKQLAEYFYRYNPSLVRKYERVWMSLMFTPFVIDHRSEEFTPDEQILLNSYKFTDLKKFEFMFNPTTIDGSISTYLDRVSIAQFDQGMYPKMQVLEDARYRLAARSGRRVEDVLTEIENRHVMVNRQLRDEVKPYQLKENKRKQVAQRKRGRMRRR